MENHDLSPESLTPGVIIAVLVPNIGHLTHLVNIVHSVLNTSIKRSFQVCFDHIAGDYMR